MAVNSFMVPLGSAAPDFDLPTITGSRVALSDLKGTPVLVVFLSNHCPYVRRIETGICHINGPTVHDEAQMPFGGVKNSGYGRFGGKAGIAEFTELRWLTVQDGHLHYPI